MPPSGTSQGNSKGNPSGLPKEAPPIPLALVEYLERTFPDRAAGEDDTVRSIRFRSGQVAVVRHLRAVYERQTRNVLSPERMNQ